jgi:superfamily II DNA/RNA helicase
MWIQCHHVINYDVPAAPEDYVHRGGALAEPGMQARQSHGRAG